MHGVKLSHFKDVKAIGFDVDGTLYVSTPEMGHDIGQEVISRAAKLLGREVDEFEEEYLERRQKYAGNTLTLNSFGLEGEKIFQKIWDEFPVQKYVSRDKKLMEMVEKLKKKYKLFILSNGTERQIVKKMEYLGLSVSDFDPFICCYDHEWAKPEPGPFLYALEQLDMRPEEVVYVGDRADVDVDAAAAVGMKTIFVGGEYESATASCETVYDILNVLLDN